MNSGDLCIYCDPHDREWTCVIIDKKAGIASWVWVYVFAICDEWLVPDGSLAFLGDTK